MKWFRALRYRPFFIRLFHWEYWSFATVYGPIYAVWILLAVRARSWFFFAAANPTILNGGFLNESKKDMYALAPKALQPMTIFFPCGSDPENVVRELGQGGLSYPLIGKPDIGGRGRGVRKLNDAGEVRVYVREAGMDFHIQEFVRFPNELGIFYYRFPGATTGQISGVVRKEFLSVMGDGHATVGELLLRDPRAVLQFANLSASEPEKLQIVPGPGEKKLVVPYGNHARGCAFYDDTARVTPELTRTIDSLCSQIDGFYFGRLDIRYDSWSELEAGQNFSLIEVNGAGSEPTHMYDPRHSLFFAWKEIIRHWWLLNRISRANHAGGAPYLTIKQGLAMFREDKLISAKLRRMG